MGQTRHSSISDDGQRCTPHDLLNRNILKQMFTWDLGTDIIKTDRINFENDVDGVYVQQIMDYCMSDDLSNHFRPIYDIIF